MLSRLISVERHSVSYQVALWRVYQLQGKKTCITKTKVHRIDVKLNTYQTLTNDHSHEKKNTCPTSPLPNKEPVIAASVVCTDFPSIGVLTDVKGNFSFKVPEEARTLTISSIGYTTQKVAISSSPMHIILKAEERITETVVITGYGATRKSAFTGAATTLSTKHMKDVPSVSIEDKLTGAIAGLNVSSISGQPGSFSTVRIRGLGSINAGNDPLYVIDGV